MRTIQCLAAFTALLAPLAVFAKIEGTYVIEVDGSNSKVADSTLAVRVDEDGQYFATLTNSLGVLLYTEDIDVDESEFEASFFMWKSKGEKQITLTGQLENGELIGKFSTGSNGIVSFTGNPDKEYETPDFNKLEVDKAIEDCYEQVTGKPMVNIQRITRDTDSELEKCVLKQVSSLQHISLWYRGSIDGLVPGLHMAELQPID